MPQRLAQHLIARGLLPARVVDEALRRQARDGGSLDTVLLEMGAISEAGVLQAIADVSGVRLVNLADFEPNGEAGPLMPLKMARQLGVVPLSLDGNALHVACSYPVHQGPLKEVGFLLGRKLEVWVALECRVRDWQRVLYGQKLDPRLDRLLGILDPSRPKARPEERALGETESVSTDVMQRINLGLVEEPVLLDRPKKKAATPPPRAQLEVVEAPVALGDEPRDSHTSVMDATAYARFARSEDGAPPAAGKAEVPLDENDSTRVVDAAGYRNFAKEVSVTARASPVVTPAIAPPARVSFPGGVLPPRPPTSAPSARKASSPPALVQPALAARPAPERRVKADTSAQPTKLIEAVARPAPVDVELDFSEVSGGLAAPGPISEVPPEPPTPPHVPEHLDVAPAPQPQAPPPPAAPTPPPATPTPPPAQAPAPEREAAAPPRPRTSVEWPRFSEEVAPTVEMSLDAAAALLVESSAPEGAEMAPAVTVAYPVPLLELPPEAVPAPAPPPTHLELRAAADVLPSGAPQESTAPADWSLAQARQALKACTQDRDQLIHVVLEYARRTFEFAGAFAVMRGAAVGWDARGEGDASGIRQLAIPLDTASIFRTVALTRGSYVGPLPPDTLSQHYLALLGRLPRTVFVWPVEVQSRLVAILYGDSGTRPVSQRRLADFILFCQELPAAFHELILFRRQHPGAGRYFASASQVMPDPGYAEEQQEEQGPVDPEWFRGLVALLTGPDPTERAMAMQELLKTPRASAQALAASFPGPTGWSRLPVVELPEPDELGPIPGAMARLGHGGAVALAPLLDSEDHDTRYLALLTAGSLRYPEVVDGVLRGLFDYEPDLSSAARAAAVSLAPLPEFQAQLPVLRDQLASPDALRCSLAARALGVLHDRYSVEALIELTGSEDALSAQSAADALKEITRVSLGTDMAAWRAWWAEAHLHRRLDWVIAALEAEDFELRLAAIEELSRAFGDNAGYFADGPLEERAAAVAQWRGAAAGRPDLDL